MASRHEFDCQMMAVALALARRGLGQTAPNPSVGAVIADEASGEILARAVTAPGGRPHAEPQAIAEAGERARGATLYVTLEPCSHFGRTPPCADAVIAAGLRRVVVAQTDPDPRVSGRGLERLRQAGIEVTRGVLTKEAHALTLGHIVRVAERRPAITLKMAVDVNGNVPRGANGQPLWVSCPESTAYAHLMRARHDAILVGGQTVIDDNPELTCRLPGLHSRSPLRVVIAGSGGMPSDCKLAETAGSVPVLIYAGRRSPLANAHELAGQGVSIKDVYSVGGRPWIPAVVEDLAARGITSVLVEGGPRIWQAFAHHGFVDELKLVVAGGGEPDATSCARETAARYLRPGQHVASSSRVIGRDRLTSFIRAEKATDQNFKG